jgi:hypothetical protein
MERRQNEIMTEYDYWKIFPRMPAEKGNYRRHHDQGWISTLGAVYLYARKDILC